MKMGIKQENVCWKHNTKILHTELRSRSTNLKINKNLLHSRKILNRKENLNHICENHQAILKCGRTKQLHLLN